MLLLLSLILASVKCAQLGKHYCFLLKRHLATPPFFRLLHTSSRDDDDHVTIANKRGGTGWNSHFEDWIESC